MWNRILDMLLKFRPESAYHMGWRHCDQNLKEGHTLAELETSWEACSNGDDYDRGFRDRLNKQERKFIDPYDSL